MKKNSEELLIRIDERVKILPAIKQDIGEIKDRLGRHSTRISLIESDHQKATHNGLLGLVLKLFGK